MTVITAAFLVHYCQHGRGTSLSDWIPVIQSKFDSKQAAFHIPIFLLPITRQIFYKRYVCDIGRCVAYSGDWADLTRTNRRLEVADLFKTKIRVSLGSAKAVTITVYYAARTVVVQGNRCTSWVREEFNALTLSGQSAF